MTGADPLDEILKANGIDPAECGERFEHTFRAGDAEIFDAHLARAAFAHDFAVATFRPSVVSGPVTFTVTTDAGGRLLSVSAEDGVFIGYQSRRLWPRLTAAWRWVAYRARRVWQSLTPHPRRRKLGA